jgi:GNAT superfamily N-acetyltransferase
VTVEVRRATRPDTADVNAVYLESWRAGYAGLLADDVLNAQVQRRARYDWLEIIERSDRFVAVAEDRQIVGVVECEHSPSPGQQPWVQMLYVVRKSWGTSAADALLDRAIAAIDRAEHPAAWLRVVEANARARRFYERHGWRLDPDMPPTSNGLFRLLSYRCDL